MSSATSSSKSKVSSVKSQLQPSTSTASQPHQSALSATKISPLPRSTHQATNSNKLATPAANLLSSPASTSPASTSSRVSSSTSTTTRTTIDVSEQLNSIRKLANSTSDYLLVNAHELNNNTLLAPSSKSGATSNRDSSSIKQTSGLPELSLFKMEGFSKQEGDDTKSTATSKNLEPLARATTKPTTTSISPMSNDSSANYPSLTSTSEIPPSSTPAGGQNSQNSAYMSILNPNSYKFSSSLPSSTGKQQHDQNTLTSIRRASLKKQNQLESTSSSPANNNRKGSNRTMPSLGNTYLSGARGIVVRKEREETALGGEDGDESISVEDEEYDEENSNKQDYEDDEEEDEVDERFPFSSTNGVNTSKSTLNQKRGEITKSSNKQTLLDSNDTYIDHHLQRQHRQRELKAYNSHNSINSNKKLHSNPHTKISFNPESRPPSFNTCQVGFQPHNHHAEACIEPICAKCSCVDCSNKRKASMMVELQQQTQRNGQVVFSTKAHSKTRSLHLVLKSIILVLLTLLLFMFLVGIIVASHYLPQVFDRLLNVSRSFNVTIAG